MKISSLLSFLILSATLVGQNLNYVDTSFNSSNYFSNLIEPRGIFKIRKQSTGKFLVLSHNGPGSSTIKRFFANGDIDNSFNENALGFSIYYFQIQNDDKLVVSDSKKVLRLHADGNIDTSFQILEVDDYINGIEIGPDNNIIVYGVFGYCNNQPINSKSIVRLYQNGIIDSTFNTSGTGSDVNVPGQPMISGISNVKALSDNRYFIMGAWTYNDVVCNDFVKINNDGSIDSTFNIGSGFANIPSVSHVEETIDHNYILIGGFDSYQSHLSKYIVKIDSNGQVDVSFTSPFNGQSNGIESFGPKVIIIREDNKILVGGQGNSSCQICLRMVQLNSDGSFDANFDMEGYFHRNTSNPTVADMILLDEKELIVAGFFDKINDIEKVSFAKMNLEEVNSLNNLTETSNNVKLYPNPTKQETTLSFSTYQKQISYKLLNLSGQVLLEKVNLYGKEMKVNLSDIPNGMYLMELKTTQGNEIVKVVKE